MAIITTNQRPKEYLFLNVKEITITHNLGYKPMVYCIINGEMALCDVTHTDNNELVATFQNATTGSLVLR
jgi:hypothetical protein